MRFELRYPLANLNEGFELGKSQIARTTSVKPCAVCKQMTRWTEKFFQTNICSDECFETIWRAYDEDRTKQTAAAHFSHFAQEIQEELAYINKATPTSKDILIVVRDQLYYVKTCIESIFETTDNFHLFIWDNASGPETEKYLADLMAAHPDKVDVMRSEANLGFVEPNNQMVAWGDGDYIILLNSDTKVFAGWDRAMLGLLQSEPEIAEVGYLGGVLNEEGIGYRADFGYDVDYISGWCACFSRETFKQFGLFDRMYRFAYCEDADFSLRLQEKGRRIYALHLLLVHHYENKTIHQVKDEGQVDVRQTFQENHERLRAKWKGYLAEKRIDVKHKSAEASAKIVEEAV